MPLGMQPPVRLACIADAQLYRTSSLSYMMDPGYVYD